MKTTGLIEKPFTWSWTVTTTGLFRFTAKAIDANGRMLNVEWGDGTRSTTDIGDGSTTANVEHTYIASGTYTVRLYGITKLQALSVTDADAVRPAVVTSDLPTPTVTEMIASAGTDITTTGFKANFAPDTGGDLTHIHYQRDTVNTFDSVGLAENTFNKTQTGYFETGLTEATTYFYRVRGVTVINGHTTYSAYSSIIEVLTDTPA